MKANSRTGRYVPLALSGCLLMSLTGCATILSGTSQTVEVRSAPHGARVVVDGRDVGTTPLKADLKRGVPHTVQVSKDGYLDETVVTTTRGNGAIALNLILGGGVGAIIDVASGAATHVTPDAVTVDLVEEAGPQNDIRLTGNSSAVSAGSGARVNLQ
jgi:hypothetical protein